MSYYKDKKILITGGTGSWGQELTKQLLQHNPKEIRIFSRGEYAQVEMAKAFSEPRLNFYIGDVRDEGRITEAMRGIDIVFHLAALKHVPIGERHIWEFVQTNVAGTKSVIEAAKTNNIDRAIFVSSDKAADPVNIYGYTKAIAEKMFITANIDSPGTKFLCIRAGNVTGTHGSVVPLFREQIKRNNKITITDKRMTRFLEIPQDMVAFLIKMCAEGKGGEIFIPKMAAVDIITLAKVMVDALGNKETEIGYIGIRPGEKLHEVLISQEEVSRVVETSDYFIILPYKFLLEYMPHLTSYVSSKNERTNEIYSSGAARMLTYEELKEKLSNLGFLSYDSVC